MEAAGLLPRTTARLSTLDKGCGAVGAAARSACPDRGVPDVRAARSGATPGMGWRGAGLPVICGSGRPLAPGKGWPSRGCGRAPGCCAARSGCRCPMPGLTPGAFGAGRSVARFAMEGGSDGPISVAAVGLVAVAAAPGRGLRPGEASESCGGVRVCVCPPGLVMTTVFVVLLTTTVL